MKENTNKLVFEKSPYLQQHAHNPIHWFPWGQEAFDLAKSLDRPIFLSIGYSTCHWCHVMEKESFSNDEVAKILNACFVCIKVDKEEMPDVDSLYMEFAQILMSSGAGWPLNVVLTPALKPFYAMTYLPPRNAFGHLGLYEIAQYIHQMWQGNGREKILAQAEEVVILYQQMQQELGKTLNPSERSISDVFAACLKNYDPAYGGKKGAPKFPYSTPILFFLEYYQIHKSPHALEMAEVTLQMMMCGGIYDHLEGGFSRYSIDDKWMIPHFEKMVSDNALLARCYLEAYKLTKKPIYKKVCTEIIEFLIKKLLTKEGGFGSAIDADSEGQEGIYYTWSEDEIDAALEPHQAQLFKELFNVTSEGNFEGRNVLFQSVLLEDFAEEKKLNLEDLELTVHALKKKLLHIRQERVSPFIDVKVILSWNCQVIDVLIAAGHAFNQEEWIKLAKQTLKMLWQHLYKEGIFYRRLVSLEVKYVANLDDYAWMIKACITCYHYGHGDEYLEKAIRLSHDVIKSFSSSDGGLYHTMQHSHALLVRRVQRQDSAEPSGQSVFAGALIELEKITYNKEFSHKLQELFASGSDFAFKHPENFISYHHMRMRYERSKSCLMVVSLDQDNTLKQELIDFLATGFYPQVTCVWKTADTPELFAEKPLIDGQTAVYICSKTHCFSPALTLEDIKKIISAL